MSISSIDELLMGGSSAQQPMSPEEKIYQQEVEPVEEYETDEQDHDAPETFVEPEESNEAQEQEAMKEPNESTEESLDEYGNEKERMSKGMKDRLDRKERQHQQEIEQREREIETLRIQLDQQGASREVQQAAKDFEFNPDASGDWQQQLAQFVKQTVNSMTREQQESQQREVESKAQFEFESKFREGMNRFDDFRDVMTGLSFEISNPMTLATRAMENPAAFLYAAAKRNPEELERISKLRDPYAQMTEMGKLEERMRRNKPTTKAPRPLGRAQEDATTKATTKQKDTSGDDLLANADVKRLNTVKTRLRSNR